MRRMNFLLTSFLCFAIAAAQQITSVLEFSAGDSFTVTCDVTKFSGAPTAYVTQLNMQRKTSTDTDFLNMAIYYPPLPAPDSFYKNPNIPSIRSWDTQFTGGTPLAANRNTVKIVMIANNTVCDDAGLYRCMASFYGSSTLISSASNLTAVASINQDKIHSDPQNDKEGGDEFTSYNPVGDNVTMKCSYTGPSNLQTLWRYSTPAFSETNYPYANSIKESQPQQIGPGNTACVSYSYSSELSIQVEPNDDNIYYCTVLYKGQERSRANFTIRAGTEPTTEPSTGGNESASAGPNVGAIVGGVIGGVVLLVLIIVLVYFFVIRKRKSGGDEDKRKNVESTDNKDNFTPPPVFYSKPHKPPKDESDGSRPVGMTNDALDISYDSKDLKGPPQYTNTVDDYEPPGYEKETHRGRANKGYEEEKEEKKEGHRSRRHRDRSEDKEKEPEDKDRREDRRSRHRDRGEAEPRGRHYSTEDGTDDRYVGYGDPNMGTSI